MPPFIGRGTAVSAVADRQAAIDNLFAVVRPDVDPEGLITKYVAFECFRLLRETFELEMIGSLQDRLKVLFWYLIDYANHRQNRLVLPLSARQIAYLNAPAPIAGASPAVTIALSNFVARDLPTHLRLTDPATLTEALYWWVVERAPVARLADRLVTDEQIAILAVEDQWIGEDFPFNAFMRIYFNRHTEFHGLDMSRPRDRAAFFHALVLVAFAKPHLVRLLPRDALRRALKARLDGRSVFDLVLARFAEPDGSDPAVGCEIHAMGDALLQRTGITLDRGGMRAPPYSDCGECFIARRDLSAPVEPGIAVIGPLRKTSGLGQATRLSMDVLSRIEMPKPTGLDFDLDNPAPVGFASKADYPPFANRRAINLIHLNAESIPLVFAFEQREVLASSYNIGYFFWELNMIPKCHALALELLDEIWVSSDYNREIYARFTDKPVVNVGMAVERLPQAKPMDRDALDLPSDSFVFLTTFDSFSFIERKNPIGVIEAFRAAFPRGTEKVALVIKTQNRTRVFDPHQVTMWKRIDQMVRADPRITIINETYQYADLLALKLACDCYVSLHRSEGWGFGMIEAMQLGRPVIATAYSGNMEFCNEETVYLVDYDLVSVREPEYIFVERGSVWAQPRIGSASARMREVVDAPAAARAKGVAASRFVQSRFGADAIGRRYRARLDEIRAAAAAGGRRH